MRTYAFVMLVAAAVTYLTTPVVRRLARRIGAITPVRDRDVHVVPIPRMGGTAMMAGFVAAMLAASQIPFTRGLFENSQGPRAVLIGALAVCALGVADDLWGLDAVTKLAGQILAAGLMAWQGIQLVSLPVFAMVIPSFGMLLVISVFVIVLTINAVNFVDGLDGLAAGTVAISASAFFVYSYWLSVKATTDYAALASLITAALVGICVGFLPHNFNPARVFMGDSGSMLLGLLLASSTVTVTGKIDPLQLERLSATRLVPALVPLILPLAVVALPLIDLALAVIRRTRAGRKPWQPDKMHLHHRLLALGHTHARAVMILYLWTATVAFGCISVAFLPLRTALLLGLAAVVAAVLLTIGPLTGLAARRSARRAS